MRRSAEHKNHISTYVIFWTIAHGLFCYFDEDLINFVVGYKNILW